MKRKLKIRRSSNSLKAAIITWYDDVFVKYMGDAVSDPEEFPELKKLYEKFRT